MAALLAYGTGGGQVNPLPPEKAFRFSARALDPQTVEARFNIADGYYLYRDKLQFVVEPAASGLIAPSLPAGKVKEDQFFGRVETYRGNVIVNLQLEGALRARRSWSRPNRRGVPILGICYPPTVQRVTVALPAAESAPDEARRSPQETMVPVECDRSLLDRRCEA